jgi:hypothetical protein
MIHGDGVSSKYSIILEGRRQEIWALPELTPDQKSDQLMDFKDFIRNTDHTEFDEYYELYKDTVRMPPARRRRTIVEDLQTHDDDE